MSEPTEQKKPAYDVIMHYIPESGPNAKAGDIVVHVVNRHAPFEEEESKTFSVNSPLAGSSETEIINRLCKEISTFAAGALIRLATIHDPDSKVRASTHMFEIAFNDDPSSPGIRVSGDAAIIDVFQSKLGMMDEIGRELIAIYDVQDGSPKSVSSFGRFYTLQNRAVAFKDTVDSARRTRFLNTMEAVANEMNRASAELKNNPVVQQRAAEKLAEVVTPPQDQAEHQKNVMQLQMMYKELQGLLANPLVTDPAVFAEKAKAMKDFCAQHKLNPSYLIPDSSKTLEEEEVERFRKYSKYFDIAQQVEPEQKRGFANNIAMMEIDVKGFYDELEKATGNYSAYDRCIKTVAGMMAVITNFLDVQGELKMYNPASPPDMHTYIIAMQQSFAAHLKEENYSLIESFLLGYMFRFMCEDVGRMDIQALSVTSKDAIRKVILEQKPPPQP